MVLDRPDFRPVQGRFYGRVGGIGEIVRGPICLKNPGFWTLFGPQSGLHLAQERLPGEDRPVAFWTRTVS